MLVAPVVDNVLHEISVGAGGDVLKEIAADGLAAVVKAHVAQHAFRSLHHGTLLQQNAFHLRVPLQCFAEKESVPPSHVHQRSYAGEVVGVEHRRSEIGTDCCHSLIEGAADIGHGREALEGRLAVKMLDGRLTRFYGVKQVAGYMHDE